MTAFRRCSIPGVALVALLLASCESVEKFVNSGDQPKPLITDSSSDPDNSVMFTIDPGIQTTAWFYFSVDSPKDSRVRVKIFDPGNWLPTNEETLLAEVETRLNGTFPKAASIPVDKKLRVRIVVEYQDEGGRWTRMGILHPVRDTQWVELAPPGAKETGMIRWAVHGDPMNGSFGVKLRTDE
jgi:hypothetical protein